MSILDYSKEITSLLMGLISVVGKVVSKPRTALMWGPRTHVSHLLPPFTDADGDVTDPKPILNAASFLIKNTGKVPLTEVEVILNFPPQSLNLWPPRPFSKREIEHDRVAISLTTLSPGEEIWFEMVAVNAPVPAALSVRSKETVARLLTLELMPVVPKWRIRALQGLSIFGVVAVVYASLWLLGGILTGNWSWLSRTGG